MQQKQHYPPLHFTVQPKNGYAAKSNGIRPMGNLPLAKGRMLASLNLSPLPGSKCLVRCEK